MIVQGGRILTEKQVELKAKPLDAVLALAPDCEKCEKSGLIVIYHRLYKGQPCITLQKRDGKPYKFHVRAVAFCNCMVGDWYRLHNPEHDPRPSLDVAIARGWQLNNPTTQDLPDHIAEGSWLQFSRWLAAEHRGKKPVQHLPRYSKGPRLKSDPILHPASALPADVPF